MHKTSFLICSHVLEVTPQSSLYSLLVIPFFTVLDNYSPLVYCCTGEKERELVCLYHPKTLTTICI